MVSTPNTLQPHRTSWALDVSLWLQRDALIELDGRVLQLSGDACWILLLGRGHLSTAATDRADFASPPGAVPRAAPPPSQGLTI